MCEARLALRLCSPTIPSRISFLAGKGGKGEARARTHGMGHHLRATSHWQRRSAAELALLRSAAAQPAGPASMR